MAEAALAGGPRPQTCWEHVMADVGFVLLTVALFAVFGMVVRGVERL
jgi:hypothetical protein